MLTSERSGAPVVVTLTPVAVERDSRTFRQAASMTRLGFVSIVVEGAPSHLEPGRLPFELRHVGSVADVARSSSRGTPTTDADTRAETLAATPWRTSRFGAAGRAFWAVAAAVPRALRAPLRPLFSRFLSTIWFAEYLVRYTREYLLSPLRIAPRASLYYLHAFYQFPAVYCLSRWYGVPYIYDAHDFYSRVHDLEPDAHLWRRWAHRFESWVERLSAAHAAAVVTVSEGLAEKMQPAFNRRPDVIRNAHDARLERAPADTLRTRLGLDDRAFLVVVIGQAKPGLAIEQVCDAVRELPREVHVAFLGGGYDRAAAAARLRYGGAEDRIHTLAPVAPTEIVPFVRSADAALLPYFALSVNYEHALPNGLFSSLTAELPVLYPALPEVVRLAQRYDFGIPIDALDPASIRGGIAALLGDPALRERLRSGARDAARDVAWEREERVLATLIGRVLGDTVRVPQAAAQIVAASSGDARV
jgi:glycosyltransferase involved in cell wall biosynthesis